MRIRMYVAPLILYQVTCRLVTFLKLIHAPAEVSDVPNLTV